MTTFPFQRLSSRWKPTPRKRPVARTQKKKSEHHQRIGPSRQPSPFPKFRLLLVWVVLLGGICGLGWKLYQLQIVQAVELRSKAKAQQTMSLRPFVPRRSIIDVQGNVLATDRLEHILYAHPIQFKQSPEAIALVLSQVLEGVTPPELIELFKQGKTGILLVRGLQESEAQRIADLKLDGLELEEKYARFYPQETTVSDVVGYVDSDRHGQAGIELSQHKLLERDILKWPVRRTAKGAIIPAYLPQDLLKSNDWQVQLTLDLRLQRAAREALQKQLKKFNAKRGAVIVMDTSDGSLLTLVCEPTFNPNEYYKAPVEWFKNWTVSDLYEPGSTFKPINVAMALDAGVIQPNTVVHDTGAVTIDGWNIFNASKVGYGTMDIARVLQTSSNVGMIQIMKHLSKQDYYSRLRQLGLEEKTGIDLPGEAAGRMKDEALFTSRAIEAATASFGQGFSLTPLKLVQLHGALANGGKLVTPHVVKGLVDVGGTLHWQPNYPVKTVFSAKTAREVVQMMETVVSKGTGKAARIPHYRIGGKTGTAQKAGPRGGYMANAKITSFVAILPVESPRYVVLTVIDEPKGGNTFGSTTAAPVVKAVMEALIAIKGIPPSN